MLKKIILAILLGLILSTNYISNSNNCTRFVPSPCGLITNVVLISGIINVSTTELKNFFAPGVEVNVILDDDTVVPGTLTSKARQGRLVKKGDQVRLNCKKAELSLENNGDKYCSLDFLRIDPLSSSCPPGSPCYGVIPSWGITVDRDGIPDTDLLTLTN